MADMLNTGTKILPTEFSTQPESSYKELAEFIDRKGRFVIMSHEEAARYRRHFDPALVFTLDDPEDQNVLWGFYIPIWKKKIPHLSILYLNDLGTILSKVSQYLVKNKKQAELMAKTIELKGNPDADPADFVKIKDEIDRLNNL
jgi:hypothetical protein